MTYKNFTGLFLQGTHSKVEYAKPNHFIAWQKRAWAVYSASYDLERGSDLQKDHTAWTGLLRGQCVDLCLKQIEQLENTSLFSTRKKMHCCTGHKMSVLHKGPSSHNKIVC